MPYNPLYTPPAGVTITVTVPGAITNAQLPDNVVDRRTIADNAIGSEEIKDGTILGTDIKDGTIPVSKLDPTIAVLIPNGSITGPKVADGAIDSNHLANGIIDDPALIGNDVITNPKIAPNTITQSRLAAASVGNSELQNDAVENENINDDEIMPVKLSKSAAFTAEQALVVDTVTGKFKTVAAGGKFETGTFTGDGGATKAVIGLGFQPRMVLVRPVGGGSLYGYWLKTDQDGINASCVNMQNFAYDFLADVIISLDADGFTVGDSYDMNVNQRPHSWLAFG